ncbi:hypothetical protein R83H12_00942 [Fibrobacteria bacterium R8-3-H12]
MLSTFQCHDLLTGKLCYSNDFGNGISLRKHPLGGSQNTFAKTSLLYIPHAGFIIIPIHHSSLPFSKLNTIKIRNSRHLKYFFYLLLGKTLGNALQLVTIFERIKNFIHKGFTIPLRFLKPWKNNKDHAEYVVADLGVQVVPHGQILHRLCATLPKIKVKIHKTNRVKFREIEIVVLPFLGKIAYNHAKVEESAANEMLLPAHLDFHDEPVSVFVLAGDIKNGASVKPCFAVHFVSDEPHLFDRAFELFGKKSVQKKQKQILASLASESFFECEVQSERRKLVLHIFETGSASLCFGHNMPLHKKPYNKNRSLVGEYRKGENSLMTYRQLFMLAGTFFLVSCSSIERNNPNDPGSDNYRGWQILEPPLSYEGETYETAVIGTQTWMARNLNYNADGSKCYNNLESNCATYGRLYDWATAMNLPSNCNSSVCTSQVSAKHRGICPSGWHIPSDDEWTTLTNFVGTNAGTKLMARSGWNDYDPCEYNPSYTGECGMKLGNGTDNYGFAALPGGYGYSSGYFSNVDDYGGSWWSATEGSSFGAYNRGIYYYDEGVRWNNYSKSFLFSVRCLQD